MRLGESVAMKVSELVLDGRAWVGWGLFELSLMAVNLPSRLPAVVMLRESTRDIGLESSHAGSRVPT